MCQKVSNKTLAVLSLQLKWCCFPLGNKKLLKNTLSTIQHSNLSPCPHPSQDCHLKGWVQHGGQLSSWEQNPLGCPFPGQFLCWLQPGCGRLWSFRGEAHQKPAGVSHHSVNEFNQEKEKIWRAGSSSLSLLTGVSSTCPWGDGSEPACKGRKGWQTEKEKRNCIKILKISRHAENQNEVGKRRKGGKHENLGRPERLLMPEKSEGLLPQTMEEGGLHQVSCVTAM